jgi:hypothetical protein
VVIMPSETASGRGGTRYLVAPRQAGSPDEARDLQEFVNLVEQTPGAAIVRTYGGPTPRRLVAEMSDQTAAELRSRFGGRLIIEPDAPLKY